MSEERNDQNGKEIPSKPEILNLIRNLHKSRESNMKKLKDIGSPAIPYLVKILKDENSDVRLKLNSLHVLSGIILENKLSCDEFLPVILDLSEKDPDYEVRGQALSLVTFCRGINTHLRLKQILNSIDTSSPAAIPYLIEALKDEDANIRLNLLYILTDIILKNKLPWNKFLPVILDILEKDPDAHIRGAAAEVIVHCGDINILPRLKEDYNREQDESAKSGIMGAIAAIGKDSVIPFLLDIINSITEEENVRGRAVVYLSTGSPRAIQALVKCMNTLRDKELVLSAATMIVMYVKDKQAIPYLIEGLRNKDPEIGAKLTEALRNLTGVIGVDYTINSTSSQEECGKIIKNWELWWEQSKFLFEGKEEEGKK